MYLLPVVQMQMCEEQGRCTRTELCVNQYNPAAKWFQRRYWYQLSVPCDIPAEAELVHLNGNYISVLHPHAFGHLGQCRELILSANRIITIEVDALSGLGNLMNLDLSRNKLSAIRQNMWTGLDKLEKLNLWKNQITRIPAGTFADLNTLRVLNLAENSITILENNAFTGLSSLHELSLQGNYLHTLQQGSFRGVHRPLLVHVTDPTLDRTLDCSAMCWLKTEERGRSVRFGRNGEPHCSGGVRWEDLQCPYQGECTCEKNEFFLMVSGEEECDHALWSIRELFASTHLCIMLYVALELREFELIF